MSPTRAWRTVFLPAPAPNCTCPKPPTVGYRPGTVIECPRCGRWWRLERSRDGARWWGETLNTEAGM